VDEADAEDVLFDYVVTIEPLLASDGRGDKRRASRQRAAALHGDDATRLKVSSTVGAAYTQRSRYAHGEFQKPLDATDLSRVRQTAFSVYLRWLAATHHYGETVLEVLDDSLLSATIRDEVTGVIERFLADHPAARPIERQ
jgi:hypothetical protein